jgi:hypothetical protein
MEGLNNVVSKVSNDILDICDAEKSVFGFSKHAFPSH